MLMSSISICVLLLIFVLVLDSANCQSAVQVQRRIYEEIDHFISRPVTTLTIWNDFFQLEGFENNLNAVDREVGAKYMYSMTRSSSYWRPFYALENGVFLGYLFSKSSIPSLAYREPGESGYPSDDWEKVIYRNACVDYDLGEETPCIMPEGGSYVSCVNNCELVKCSDPDSQRDCSLVTDQDERSDCESKTRWCTNYSIQQANGSLPLGYIPRSDYCYNSKGLFSQTSGDVLVSTESGDVELGDCTFGSGDPVFRQKFGPYANCGGDGAVCNTTFIGAYKSSDYDPRWRGWYVASRAAQHPLWSNPYVFFSRQEVGITYTQPLISKNSKGRSIFFGTLAADLLLGGISDYLVKAFSDTDFSIAIYETGEPYSIIATSTGSPIVKKVLKEDPTQLCSEEQFERGECTSVQLTIDELEATPDDVVLRNAHYALEEKGFDPSQIVDVKEIDEVGSTTYLATFVIFDRPGENLEWRIIVTMPLQRDEFDSIVKGDFLFVIISVLAGLGFIICMTLVVLFFGKRNERAVVLADFKFTSAFVFMCAFLNLSSFTLLGENTDEKCMLQMWAYYMLSAMALSPLFVKAFRTWTLLGTPPSLVGGRSQMNNCQAWLRTVPIPLIQCVMLVAFTIFDPPSATEKIMYTGSVPSQSITCQYGTPAFPVVHTIFYSILIATGCFLAFLTRNIDPKFADSKALIFSMYNIAFTVVMFAAIFSVVEISESGINMMTTIGIFWGSVFSSMVFVVPKLLAANDERRKSREQMLRLRTSHTNEITKRFSSHAGISSDSIHESEETLKVLICSANMGNAEPTLSSMKAWIPEGGRCDDITTLEEAPIDAERFDLIVIGMQEATWSSKMKRQDSKSDNGNDDNDSVDEDLETNVLAAVEGADTVSLRKMEKTLLGEHYRQVAEESRGQMRLHIWALENVAPFLEDVKVSGANTGIGNVLANKGGIVISFTFQRTRLTFLSAHLAAHEGESYYKARCENVYDILKASKTCKLSEKFDHAISSHHMFVFGDLNFRTKFDDVGHGDTSTRTKDVSIRTKDTSVRSKNDKKDLHEEHVQRALDLVKKKDFYTLYSYDELHKGVNDGDLLFGFETLPCRFHPTFKVERMAGFVYKDQRTPSYTDRILFKSAPGLEGFMKPLVYEPCVDFVTSDHKPIRGAFSIATNEMIDPMNMEWQFRMVFSEMECCDLPAGDSSGTSDPFLMFMWDSIELSEEKQRKFRLPQLFFRDSGWPKTNYISKTLNPKWKGKEIVLVSCGREINSEATLYVSAYDYDFGAKADVLGTVALNIQDLVSMKRGQSTKELLINRRLQANGKYAGRIKCKLVISAFIG